MKYVLMGCLTLLCCGLQADDVPVVEPVKKTPYLLQIGAFYPDISTTVRLDSNIGEQRGTTLDMESNLGLPDRQGLFHAEFDIKVSKKWTVGVDYFSLKRSSVSRINRQIVWGNQTYLIDTELSSFFDTTIWRAYGLYEWKQSEKVTWGGVLGLHAFDVAAGLGLTPRSGNPQTDISAAESSNLPLPNIGLHWNYQLNPKWMMNARLDWFALSIDDYSGNLVNAEVAGRYFITDNLAAGLSLSYFKLDISMDRTLWQGEFDLRFWGPKLFTSYRW